MIEKILAIMLSLILLPSFSFAKTVQVKMTGDGTGMAFSFEPKQVTIGVGDTIKWINVDKNLHDATNNPDPDFGGGSDVSGPTVFDSGFVATDGTYEYKFTKHGTYNYICVPHHSEQMKGTIIVK